MTRRPKKRCPWRVIKLPEWPERERRVWAVAISPASPFDAEAGRLARRRPATLDLYASSYGHWLGWLEHIGALQVAEAPENRATRDRLTAYWRAMKAAGLADFTISIRLANLAHALKALNPGGDWRWINRAAGRIANAAMRRNDPRQKMRPPEEIVQLGRDLMDQADALGEPGLETAIQYRDGLVLALQTFRALRGKNLGGLVLGRTLLRTDGGWRIDFSSSDMKGRRPLVMPWPESLVSHLERYIGFYRPVFLAGLQAPELDEGALWYSPSGKPMSPGLLRKRLRIRTGRALGVAINTHSFRHIAATTIAEADPNGVTNIAGLLGHSTLGTSEKYYNQARQIAAADRYAAILQIKRRRRRGEPQPHGGR